MDSNIVMAAATSMLPDPSSPLTRMINLELHYRLPELLLMRVDKMTMAHSLEARVPFLDHRLVESTFDLPTDWKIAGDHPKSLFKDAVRGMIPDEIIDRPKTGFGAPVSAWLRGQLGKLVEDEIGRCPLFFDGWFDRNYISKMFEAHRRGKGDFGACLWALYNLAVWHRLWICRATH
jgi:asparagine synthase (glutamine-hydrolysing)